MTNGGSYLPEFNTFSLSSQHEGTYLVQIVTFSGQMMVSSQQLVACASSVTDTAIFDLITCFPPASLSTYFVTTVIY